MALADEYAERGMDVVKSCKDCPRHLGCEDCMMDGTRFCKKIMMEKSCGKTMDGLAMFIKIIRKIRGLIDESDI